MLTTEAVKKAEGRLECHCAVQHMREKAPFAFCRGNNFVEGLQRKVSCDDAEVEKDCGVEQCLRLRQLYPFFEKLLPDGQRFAPVGCHETAWARRKAGFNESIDDPLRQRLKVNAGFFRAVLKHERVVLIREQCLLQASLRAEDDPSVGSRRRA